MIGVLLMRCIRQSSLRNIMIMTMVVMWVRLTMRPWACGGLGTGATSMFLFVVFG